MLTEKLTVFDVENDREQLSRACELLKNSI